MAQKILIAEDERPLSGALQEQFKNAGFDVRAAFDGQEALNILDMEKFDLILLDLLMPKVNGLDVLQNLKNRRNTIPIIVLSNLSDDSEIKKAKDLGATDYFIKSDIALADVLERSKKAMAVKPEIPKGEYGKGI